MVEEEEESRLGSVVVGGTILLHMKDFDCHSTCMPLQRRPQKVRTAVEVCGEILPLPRLYRPHDVATNHWGSPSLASAPAKSAGRGGGRGDEACPQEFPTHGYRCRDFCPWTAVGRIFFPFCRDERFRGTTTREERRVGMMIANQGGAAGSNKLKSRGICNQTPRRPPDFLRRDKIRCLSHDQFDNSFSCIL